MSLSSARASVQSDKYHDSSVLGFGIGQYLRARTANAQTSLRMRRLVCAFAVRTCRNVDFLVLMLINKWTVHAHS